jgi:hypothetical protein
LEKDNERVILVYRLDFICIDLSIASGICETMARIVVWIPMSLTPTTRYLINKSVLEFITMIGNGGT